MQVLNVCRCHWITVQPLAVLKGRLMIGCAKSDDKSKYSCDLFHGSIIDHFQLPFVQKQRENSEQFFLVSILSIYNYNKLYIMISNYSIVI